MDKSLCEACPVSFRVFIFVIKYYLPLEFQLHTSSTRSISKGLFDVLLRFSVNCRDFGYLHVYSLEINILLSILKATPILFHKYLPKTLFEMTDVAL